MEATNLMISPIIELLVPCTMVFLYFLMGLFYSLGDRFDKDWFDTAGNICVVLIAVIGGVTIIATIAGCIIYLLTNI